MSDGSGQPPSPWEWSEHPHPPEAVTDDHPPPVAAPPPVSRRRPRPLVTNLLVAANIIVFLLQTFQWGLENSVVSFGHDQIAVWDGELWRLLTAPFLHGGWGHLLMNCFGLFLLGEIVESRLGKWRLLVIYTVAGIGGGLVFQAIPAAIGVGASGAVYGLAGTLLVIRFGHVAKGRFRLRPAFFIVVIVLCTVDWLFAELLARASVLQVATTAHLGGLVFGSVAGYVAQYPEQPVSAARRRTLTIASAVLLIALAVYGCWYPFLNPAWPVWSRIQTAVAKGRVDQQDVQAAESLSPELVRRVIVNVVEAGKESEARARAAAGDREERERYAVQGRHRFEQAVNIWSLLKESALKRVVGYPLFDELMGLEVDDLAKRVLDELIKIARLDMAQKLESDEAPSRLERADSLNDLAWFLALQGEQLREALQCAEAAVSLIRGRPEGGLLSFADQLRYIESAYVNTLGWVQFLIGEDTELALKNLQEAVDLAPLGPNYLYLGMAYARLGDVRAATEALRKAEDAGGLSPREERLFRDVRDELGI